MNLHVLTDIQLYMPSATKSKCTAGWGSAQESEKQHMVKFCMHDARGTSMSSISSDMRNRRATTYEYATIPQQSFALRQDQPFMGPHQ